MKSLATFFMFLIIGLSSESLHSQCLEGEAYLSFEITTDQYGYELYFEITPFGDACGVNTLASYGNTYVGCDGGGLKSANAQDNGVFPNSSTTLEEYGCIALGTQINIHAIDDWGDGESVIGVRINGFLTETFTASQASHSWTYTVSAPNNYDMELDYDYSDPNGWTFNHIAPVYDLYYPLNQLTNSETHMGLAVHNLGTQKCTNVYARLNIDKLNETSNTYETVFTDTLKYGNLTSETSKIRNKNITDTDWYSVGKFRYVYSVLMDENDQDESNNSLSNTFEITEDYWSKTPLDNNNDLAVTNETYFPGTQSYIDAYEWGSFFYFENGNDIIIDKINAVLYSYPTANIANGDVQTKIYEVNIQGDGLDMETDLSNVGINLSTVNHNPGNSVAFEASKFYNASNGELMGALKNNTLYYISIYQQQLSPPYLNDGQVNNGFAVHGNSINQDFLVNASESNSFPYYSPVFITEQKDQTVYSYGFSGGPEPTLGITLRENPLSVKQNNALLDVSIAPIPTKNKLNINLNTLEGIDYTFVITDISNRVIYLEKSNFINNSKNINTAYLAPGTYILAIKSKTGHYSQKFVKN